MPREEDPDAGVTSGSEHFSNVSCNGSTIADMVDNTDLHVVDDESQATRVAHLLETLRHLQAVCSLHCVTSFNASNVTPVR